MQSARSLPLPAGAILRLPPPPMLRPPPPPIAPVPPPPSFVRALTEDAKSSPSEESDSDGDEEEEDNTSQADFEMMEDNRKARERHELALQELQLCQHSYALAVPTNDHLSEPVTSFGEREMERHDRLRSLMARMLLSKTMDSKDKIHVQHIHPFIFDEYSYERVSICLWNSIPYLMDAVRNAGLLPMLVHMKGSMRLIADTIKTYDQKDMKINVKVGEFEKQVCIDSNSLAVHFFLPKDGEEMMK